MAQLISGYAAMPKKDNEAISPYLRRRLRSYEEVRREQADGKKRPNRSKVPTKSVTRDERNDR